MTSELRERLAELDRLLGSHAFARRMLRPPATTDSIMAAAETLKVDVPETVVRLYAWHDGSAPRESGRWPLYLFPTYWEFMPLHLVVREAEWPLTWCRDHGKLGFPIALDETGQFLVAADDAKDVLWRVSSDDLLPAWPDGTLLGLIEATAVSLRGESPEYAAEFAPDRMSWIAQPGGAKK